MNVNIGQFPIQLNIQTNLNEIVEMIKQVSEDEVLILPEGALSGYDDDLTFLENINKEELDKAFHHIVELVRGYRVHLIFGSCLHEEGHWFNGGIYVSPEGKVNVYHKVNLAVHERRTFTAGADLPTFEMACKDRVVRFGIQLCREIRFPEQWKYLSLQGADFIAYLTNVISTDSLPIWKSHLISRAAENQRFIIGANVAHPNQGCPTMVISPKGNVLEEIISGRSELKKVEINLEEVSDWYLNQSRTDVVQIKK